MSTKRFGLWPSSQRFWPLPLTDDEERRYFERRVRSRFIFATYFDSQISDHEIFLERLRARLDTGALIAGCVWLTGPERWMYRVVIDLGIRQYWEKPREVLRLELDDGSLDTKFIYVEQPNKEWDCEDQVTVRQMWGFYASLGFDFAPEATVFGEFVGKREVSSSQAWSVINWLERLGRDSVPTYVPNMIRVHRSPARPLGMSGEEFKKMYMKGLE